MSKSNLNKKKNRQSTFSIQLMECAMVVAAIIFSLAFSGKVIYQNIFPFGIIDGILIYAVISSTGVILLGVNRYFSFLDRGFVETITKIFAIVIILNFIFIAMLYFSKSLRLSPYYFIVADVTLFFLLFLVKRISAIMKRGILKNRLTLVVGKNVNLNPILRALKKENSGKLAFAAFDDPNIEKYLDRADNIYLSGVLSRKFKEQVISYCAMKDKKLFVVPETYEIAMRKSEITQVDDIPFFSIDSFRLTQSQRIMKRACDIILAVIGIILCSPLMIYAAVRIKLEDGGPIFYKQERSGLEGRVFRVIKFRSMIMDAEKYTGAVFASENDPRVTKIGRLMRNTRIDEIPQFFNVLAGSMSLVGPRPERPVFVKQFCKELPEYNSRLAVKPGITGLAQVMGNYTTSSYNKVKFDLVYIRNYSLWLDFKILFKTVQVVFRKEQAAGFKECTDTQAIDNLKPEKAFESILLEHRAAKYRGYRVAKGLGIILCCTVVILGSVFLRYSAVALAMMEATAHEDSKIQLIASSNMIDSSQNLDLAVATFGSQISEAEPYQDTYPDGEGGILGETENAPNEIEGINRYSKNNEQSETMADSLKSKETNNLALSSKEIEYALSQITMKEKVKIGLNFLSKLNTADLMFLEKMAAGGFTAKEKEAAKVLLYERFNEDEIAYIKKVYREYVE